MPQLLWGVSFSLKVCLGPVAPAVHCYSWVSTLETLCLPWSSGGKSWQLLLVVFPVRISN